MYEDLKIFLSEDKLKPYFNMVNNDKEKAIKLYELNLEISSQFYKLIQILEVSSRNIFNKYISVKYYDNWLFNENLLNGNDNKTYNLINDIKTAKEDLKKCNIICNCSNIIPKLSFNFLVMLLSNNHKDKIWKPIIKRIFYGYNREIIYEIFKDVRDFRNRISHQEIIINKDMKYIYDSIYFILNIRAPKYFYVNLFF